MTAQLRKLALVFSLASTAACGANFHQPTPDKFVKLDDQTQYSYRAVSADGLVYAVKEIENESKGDVDFWATAIENKLRFQAGYALLAKEDIATKSGLKGRQLHFGFDRGKTPHLYDITVFTTDEHIFVLESGGTKALMEAHKGELDQALASFRLD